MLYISTCCTTLHFLICRFTFYRKTFIHSSTFEYIQCIGNIFVNTLKKAWIFQLVFSDPLQSFERLLYHQREKLYLNCMGSKRARRGNSHGTSWAFSAPARLLYMYSSKAHPYHSCFPSSSELRLRRSASSFSLRLLRLVFSCFSSSFYSEGS